jgi:hypothetical protein
VERTYKIYLLPLVILGFFLVLPPLVWQYFHSANQTRSAITQPELISEPVSQTRSAIAQAQPISQTIAQPLTLYQPLQHLQWQGQISKTGIAYFPVAGFANEFTADADRAIALSGIGSESDLDAARAMKDTGLIAKNLAALGLSRHLQGEYDQALNYYKQGL